eukprot:m.91789 g.91789  ORF g.91789 m.91789 type:complete len:747 (+) comp20203_c0_seq1:164-2404(+)
MKNPFDLDSDSDDDGAGPASASCSAVTPRSDRGGLHHHTNPAVTVPPPSNASHPSHVEEVMLEVEPPVPALEPWPAPPAASPQPLSVGNPIVLAAATTLVRTELERPEQLPASPPAHPLPRPRQNATHTTHPMHTPQPAAHSPRAPIAYDDAFLFDAIEHEPTAVHSSRLAGDGRGGASSPPKRKRQSPVAPENKASRVAPPSPSSSPTMGNNGAMSQGGDAPLGPSVLPGTLDAGTVPKLTSAVTATAASTVQQPSSPTPPLPLDEVRTSPPAAHQRKRKRSPPLPTVPDLDLGAGASVADPVGEAPDQRASDKPSPKKPKKKKKKKEKGPAPPPDYMCPQCLAIGKHHVDQCRDIGNPNWKVLPSYVCRKCKVAGHHPECCPTVMSKRAKHKLANVRAKQAKRLRKRCKFCNGPHHPRRECPLTPCKICNGPNHPRKECPLAVPTAGYVCKLCGVAGHYVEHCEKAKTQTPRPPQKPRTPGETNRNTTAKHPVRPECKFWARGSCQKGDKCPFSHDRSMELGEIICRFHVSGNCLKGDTCPYSHDLKLLPCRFFHGKNGRCGRPGCPFSHGAITDGQRLYLDQLEARQSDRAAAVTSPPPKPEQIVAPWAADDDEIVSVRTIAMPPPGEEWEETWSYSSTPSSSVPFAPPPPPPPNVPAPRPPPAKLGVPVLPPPSSLAMPPGWAPGGYRPALLSQAHPTSTPSSLWQTSPPTQAPPPPAHGGAAVDVRKLSDAFVDPTASCFL